jgi:hypothetical protein
LKYCIFQAFGDAYALVEPTLKAGEVMTPYVIKNVTGEDLMLKLDNAFEVKLEIYQFSICLSHYI